MLGSIAQLVQSVCLTSRGSGVRLPLLPLRKHFGISEVLFLFVRHGLHTFIATCALKRFLRTSLSKLIMSCANRAFLLTRESSRVVESKLHPSHDGLSTFHGYLVPNKRFKRYQVHFQSHLVPFKTFSRNGIENRRFRCYLTLT
ncbi:unknown [Bacteroides sp. CAG:709]|nr:unknown [Bacteroides sp. CAG:709]